MRRKDSVLRGVRCLLASLMALVLTMTPAVPALAEIDPSIADIVLHAQAGEFAVIRLAGADRYETMAKIVEQGFGSSDWAVVATGDDFPDALCGAAVTQQRSECERLGHRRAGAVETEVGQAAVLHRKG